MALLRAIARRSRLPAAGLAVGTAAFISYTHGAEDEYRTVSEEELPLTCAAWPLKPHRFVCPP